MSAAKVIEIIAKSDKSWEDAAQKAVTDAAKSVQNIQSVYMKEMEAKVENDKIVEYKATTKITFIVER
jgi:hypothetical protein